MDFSGFYATLDVYGLRERTVAQDRFTAAVDDSYLLLAFLCRRSLTMDASSQQEFARHADTMARIQTQVSADRKISEPDRAAFWESFTSLAQLAEPVTIESIRRYLRLHSRLAGRAAVLVVN